MFTFSPRPRPLAFYIAKLAFAVFMSISVGLWIGFGIRPSFGTI